MGETCVERSESRASSENTAGVQKEEEEEEEKEWTQGGGEGMGMVCSAAQVSARHEKTTEML